MTDTAPKTCLINKGFLETLADGEQLITFRIVPGGGYCDSKTMARELLKLRAALEQAHQEADDHLEDLQLAGYHHKIWYPNAVRLVEHLKEALHDEPPVPPT